MEQPKDMAEMVLSLMRVARSAGDVVIPTIVHHNFIDLSTTQRQMLAQYMGQVVATAIIPANTLPGQSVVMRQTDYWYGQHDPNGEFGRLRGIAQVVSERNR